MLDNLAILDKNPLNLNKFSVVSSISSNKLCDNCHGLGSINLKTRSFSIKSLVSQSPGVQVTAIFITHSVISVSRIIVSTVNPLTWLMSNCIAGVGSVGGCLAVGLPYVHFITARSNFSLSRINIIVARYPSLNINNTTNELQIMRALCITVASAIGSSRLVSFIFTHTTILFHFNKVEGTIQATRELRYINIEGELPVQQFEHLILLAARFHQVNSASIVIRILAVCDKF